MVQWVYFSARCVRAESGAGGEDHEAESLAHASAHRRRDLDAT